MMQFEYSRKPHRFRFIFLRLAIWWSCHFYAFRFKSKSRQDINCMHLFKSDGICCAMVCMRIRHLSTRCQQKKTWMHKHLNKFSDGNVIAIKHTWWHRIAEHFVLQAENITAKLRRNSKSKMNWICSKLQNARTLLCASNRVDPGRTMGTFHGCFFR